MFAQMYTLFMHTISSQGMRLAQRGYECGYQTPMDKTCFLVRGWVQGGMVLQRS